MQSARRLQSAAARVMCQKKKGRIRDREKSLFIIILLPHASSSSKRKTLRWTKPFTVAVQLDRDKKTETFSISQGTMTSTPLVVALTVLTLALAKPQPAASGWTISSPSGLTAWFQYQAEAACKATYASVVTGSSAPCIISTDCNSNNSPYLSFTNCSVSESCGFPKINDQLTFIVPSTAAPLSRSS